MPASGAPSRSNCRAAISAKLRSTDDDFRIARDPVSAAQYADWTAGPITLPGRTTRTGRSSRYSPATRQREALASARIAASTSRSQSTSSSAASTTSFDQGPPTSASRACARTGDRGSRHSAAPRAIDDSRTSTSIIVAPEQRVDRDAATFRKRAGGAPEQHDSAICFFAEVGRQDRRHRTAIAEVEELDQPFFACGDRLRRDRVDDRRARPVRSDLDVDARCAAGEIVVEIRIVPLAREFAHAVFAQAEHARHAEQLAERRVELVTRNLARLAFEPARLDDPAADRQLESEIAFEAAVEEVHEGECGAEDDDGAVAVAQRSCGAVEVELTVADEETAAGRARDVDDLREHVRKRRRRRLGEIRRQDDVFHRAGIRQHASAIVADERSIVERGGLEFVPRFIASARRSARHEG